MGEVERALQSREYEVRAAALKQLVKQLNKSLSPSLAAPYCSTPSSPAASTQLGAEADALRGLRAVLLAHLQREQHHKGVRRTLCLLALLPAGPAPAPAPVGAGRPIQEGPGAGLEAGAGAGEGAGAQLFSDLLLRAQEESDPAVRQYAVRCLGQLLRLPLAAAAAGGGVLEQGQAAPAAAELLAVLEDCSQPWQLPELRLAAAAALEASGLLALPPEAGATGAGGSNSGSGSGGSGGSSGSGGGSCSPAALPSWVVEAAVRGWAVSMRLMEDEDDEVRDRMAGAAADAAGGCSGQQLGTGTGAAGEWVERPQQQQQRGSLQRGATVEWVERGVLPALAARLGPYPALVRQLCTWACAEAIEAQAAGQRAAAGGAPASEGGGAASAAAAGGSGEGRRLFDKELDNNHEEPLLVAQVV